MKLIKQGAEAKLWQTNFNGNQTLIKERTSKKYRNKKLDDKIKKERLKIEVNGILRARKAGVRTPLIYKIDKKKYSIYFEFIKGHLLKEELIKTKKSKKELLKILEETGRQINLLHNNDLIHGDLTTSNIILKEKTLVFLDFGLFKISNALEDKAMDLVVFERTFTATHANIEEGWTSILKGYSKINKESTKVFQKMNEIKKRARYL